ncbi:MAG: 50S ribosomal protein L20 [Candidatus Omnitrophica bacterium]|nr:50S ribosomal protein L20 [Candidatus Omnitrophota bacterium]MCM8798475.1 50S ribosomal protein L20 [Candidatus Omnitrophota bacterium]
MPRVKHSVATHKRHKKILKQAKGYWGARSKLYRRAKETVQRALVYSYRDRKVKKRQFRRLWITRISIACKNLGISYNRFMQGLKEAKVDLNRRILADLAVNDPDAFTKLVELVKSV